MLRSALILSLLFAVLAYAFRNRLLNLLIPQTENVIFISTDEESEIFSLFRFCLVVGIIPLFVAATWKMIPLEKNSERLYSFFVVAGCIIAALAINYHQLKNKFLMQNEHSLFPLTFYNSELNTEWFVMGGMFAGFLLCYVFFKKQ